MGEDEPIFYEILKIFGRSGRAEVFVKGESGIPFFESSRILEPDFTSRSDIAHGVPVAVRTFAEIFGKGEFLAEEFAFGKFREFRGFPDGFSVGAFP